MKEALLEAVTASATTVSTVTTTSTALDFVNATETTVERMTYSIPQMVIIAVVATILSILTVVGNCMVMISFKIDKQLQTISNYFLFSLAVADFAIGLISMPLFTVSTLLGYWPLGPHICDTWLALDYLASNASVLNLLIISFDRYFSVTRPLTYRAKRTTSRAAVMIGSAWGISLLLWPPWIYSWPYIEGKRTVPNDECYIQFIETNHYITFGTAIAAFYVPVSVMCFLYFRIWRETKKRQKDLPNLQAGKKDSSKRSNSSDEATNVNHTNIDVEAWKRPRSESAGDVESVYMSNLVGDNQSYTHSQRSRTGGLLWYATCGAIREWCVAWWHSGRDDFDETDVEEPSDMGYATPVSIETPLQSSVSRCTSLNVIRDPYASGGRAGVISTVTDASPVPLRQNHGAPQVAGTVSTVSAARDSRSLPPNSRLGARSVSSDSVYTILIRLPPDGSSAGTEPADRAPSIKMISDDAPLAQRGNGARGGPHNEFSLQLNPLGRRASHVHDIRIPLNAKIIPKQLAGKPGLLGTHTKHQVKKKKKSQEKKQETKAAKTLSAILLSFIITWTPYNILVLLKPLTACINCIPDELWSFFYALCYINSTINPMCYALCNASFRRTYVRILTCKWQNRNREAMTRGVYN